jgi:hypothetical protein
LIDLFAIEEKRLRNPDRKRDFLSAFGFVGECTSFLVSSMNSYVGTNLAF